MPEPSRFRGRLKIFTWPRRDKLELTRETGIVTRGTEVRFAATDDSTGNEFGFWSAVATSDNGGAASAEFTPGNTAERGEATIRASVPGTGLSATLKVEIVP